MHILKITILVTSVICFIIGFVLFVASVFGYDSTLQETYPWLIVMAYFFATAVMLHKTREHKWHKFFLALAFILCFAPLILFIIVTFMLSGTIW